MCTTSHFISLVLGSNVLCCILRTYVFLPDALFAWLVCGGRGMGDIATQQKQKLCKHSSGSVPLEREGEPHVGLGSNDGLFC